MEENEDLKTKVEKPISKVVRAVGKAEGTSTADAIGSMKERFSPHDTKVIARRRGR